MATGYCVIRWGVKSILGLSAIAILVISFLSTFHGLLLVLPVQLATLGMTSELSVAKWLPFFQMVALLGGYIARRLTQDGKHFRHNLWITKGVAAFGAFLAISFPVSIILGNDVISWVRDVSPFANYFLFFPAADTIRTNQRLKVLLVFVGIFLLWSAISALLLWGAARGVLPLGKRYLLIWGTPFAGYIMFLCLFALWLERGAKFSDFTLLAALNFVFVTCLMQGTRNILIGLALSIVVIYCSYAGGRKAMNRQTLKIMVGVLLMGLVFYQIISTLQSKGIISTSPIIRRFSTLTSPVELFHRDTSVFGRFAEFQRARDALRENLLFGRGLGYWFIGLPEALQGYHWWRERAMTPDLSIDNGYAYLLVKFGLVGTSVFVFFFIALLITTYNSLKNQTRWRFLVVTLWTLLITMPWFMIASGPIFRDRVVAYVVAVLSGIVPRLKCGES